MPDENALIVYDEIDLDLVFSSNDAVTDVLSKLKVAAEAHVPDLETDAGRKAIASNSYKVSQCKTWMVKHAMSMTETWRKRTKEVNELKKRVETFCDELRDSTRKPLTDYEEAEKAERERKRKELEMLNDWDEALSENDRIDKEREMEQKLAEFERKEQERLGKERSEREERERKEREERIAKEAAERVKRDLAEQAEKARIAAEKAVEDAKREKEAAERREADAKEHAEKARIAAIEKAEEEKMAAIEAERRKAQEEADRKEKERLASIAEQERLAAEEKRKADQLAANLNHQKKFNLESLESLVSLGFSEDAGKQFVSSVAKGLVKHITIQY